MNKIENQFVWVEAYRPQTIEECILPARIKNVFKGFIEKGESPNLLLTGKAGIGKTTAAQAMLKEIGCNYLFINASKNRNIATLDVDIANFASSVSFIDNKRKFVILDEADWLNPNSTQPALRSFMETYSVNCGFILTCNYKNKIMKEIHSRCSVINFNIQKKELPLLAAQFMKHTINILENESIAFDKAVIAELIKLYMPDWRRLLNELQSYAMSNNIIDIGILNANNQVNIDELIKFMKDKNFDGIRKWVSANTTTDMHALLREFYDNSVNHFMPIFIPQMITLINDAQYRAAFVMDQEINLCDFLHRVTSEAIWK